MAFDGFGTFQPQYKTFGFAACAVQVFFGVSTGDGVEELDGLRAYAFWEADLVDAHWDASDEMRDGVVRVNEVMGDTLRLRSVARGTTAGGGMVDRYGN